MDHMLLSVQPEHCWPMWLVIQNCQ